MTQCELAELVKQVNAALSRAVSESKVDIERFNRENKNLAAQRMNSRRLPKEGKSEHLHTVAE